MPTDQMNIYLLLDQLRIRKGMFLGNDYNFKLLESFLNGFMMAASEYQLQLNGIPNFSYFSTWLLGHLKTHFGLGGGWHWQISNRNINNEDKAFEEFFAFLDLFKTSKTHSKSILLEQNYFDPNKQRSTTTYQIIDGKEIPLTHQTHKIIWKTIDNSTTVWLDYIDANDKIFLEGIWYITAEEATDRLINEFGTLEDRWIEDN